MAEYVYNIDGFSLTSNWKISKDYVYNAEEDETQTVISLVSIQGDSTTKTVDISDIVLGEGENIKRVVISATLNRVGTTDYSERITVNGLSFYSGTRKLDATTFSPSLPAELSFYFCASGDVPIPDGNGLHSYSCTMYYSDVTLTITTGVGSAFDGLIGSLPDGTKLLIDEPDGVQGTYSIVHHKYGDDTLCLLWRDNCIASSIAFNHNEDTFLATNYGKLDEFLNSTFYEGLPDTTKPYIQPAIYPTLDKRLYGTVTELERYVCTPSVRELTETTGGAEWHGIPFDYLDTVACDETYWTRSVYTSSAGYAYRINTTGSSYTYSRDYSGGVRPCFCVLEEQLVTPGDADATYYVLASGVAAPADVYLNGATTDLSGQQRDTSATLSWDAVASSLVTGYEVWSCDTVDGEYAFLGAVTAADDGTIPTELIVRTGSRGFAETFFKVKAVTIPDTDYLDSDLSANYRSMATKRTNVHYYDGTRWLLAMPNHYNGSWTQTEGMKYFDGSQWIVPGT